MQIMAGKRELQVKLEGGKVERSAPSGCIINPAPGNLQRPGGVSGVSGRERAVLPRAEAKC